MLNEVEQVCDRVAIINKGLLIREGPVETLLQVEVGPVRLQVQPMDTARQVISARWGELHLPIEEENEKWLKFSANPEQVPLIVAELVKAGVQIFQVIQKRQSLEEFFIAVTNQQDAADA
jgi:ABC-2 type transport system ATP-binding protein